jgi:uncharacterized protein (TIGR00251 family)
MTFSIKVKPGSKKEGIAVVNNEVVVRVHAPAVDGKANEALIRFLSEFLDVAKSQITIVSGHTSRIKRVDIPDLAAGKLQALIRV